MIARLWRDHRLLLVAFVVAAGLAGLFGVRAVVMAIRWHGIEATDAPLAGWMTPRYVSHSWQVPPEVVGAALGIDQNKPRRVTLEQLAEDRGVPLQTLIDGLQAGIDRFRAGHP